MVTQYIKNATYKEIYDIHTDSENTSILTFHTPVNLFPRKMLEGFFKQYRRFKYKGATVRIQPTARLPADPEQISYEAGEPGIDPRDMVNPMLIRGYCGDSLGTFLNRYLVPGSQGEAVASGVGETPVVYNNSGFTGSSVDKTSFPDSSLSYMHDIRSAYLEKLYYQSLGDPKFHKIGVQRGYKKFFYPLVYELATTTQYLSHNSDFKPQQSDIGSSSAYGGLVNNIGTGRQYGGDNLNLENVHNDFAPALTSPVTNDATRGNNTFPMSENLPYMIGTKAVGNATDGYRTQAIAYRMTSPVLTSHKRRLGWLDTDSLVVRAPYNSGAVVNTQSAVWPNLPNVTGPFNGITVEDTTLPLINMGICILPKAYKTEMCYRLSIVHHFDFKDYRPMHGLVSPFDNDTMGITPILEWADWEDAGGYGAQVYASSSVSSTSKNVELVDVEGSNPLDMGDNFDEPLTA